MGNVSLNLGFFITFDLQILCLETEHKVNQQLQVFIVITNDWKNKLTNFLLYTIADFD